MIRNRNGFWMSPKFFMSAGDGGSAGDAGMGGSTSAPAGDGADVGEASSEGAEDAKNTPDGDHGNDSTPDARDAEIARLKAEMARQKAAMDKATKEAGEARKALKAKMTAEEIAANDEKEAKEAQAKRIAELEKQVARADTVKSVMGKLGLDENTAGNLADHLYGASDIDNALLEIQKAWQAKEKALKLEYGKLTGPGAGADSNSPEAQAIKRAAELGKARNAQNEQAQKAMNAYMR